MESRSFGLDVLRTVSVWMVLLSHVAYWFNPGSQSAFYSVVKPLLLGVEPFFVLGGFLAAISFQSVISRNAGVVPLHDGALYVKRRWLRTFPNYFLFLFIYALAFYAVKPNFEFDLRYLVFSQNLFWLMPNFFSVSWSLAAQEWFYVLLPLLMVLLGKVTVKTFRFNPLLVGSLFLVLLSFVSRYLFLEVNPAQNLEGELRRITLLRLDSIGVGVFVGFLYFKAPAFFDKYGLGLFWCGLLFIITLAYLRKYEPFSAIYAVQMVYFPIFSLCIGLLLPYIYTVKRFTSRWIVRIFESTSKWSYSIYLCHVLFLDALYLIGKKAGIDFTGGLIVWLMVILWLAMTYLSSALIYKYYEKPWLKYGKSA